MYSYAVRHPRVLQQLHCHNKQDKVACRRWSGGVHLGGKAGGVQAQGSQSLVLMRGLASPPEPDCVPMLLC